MTHLAIRTATEADLERLVEIHTAAYPSDASFERRKRSFTESGLGASGAVRVVERSGRIIAHAKLLDLTVWLGGEPVRTGGIGSVAVAPEARGVGVGRWMMGQLHAELDRGGAALALLYPFREGFYAALGYATTAPLLSLSVESQAVARAFPREPHDALFEVVAIEGPWLGPARELYAAVARRSAGRLTRSEARWLRVLATEGRHVVGVVSRQSGALEGYLVFVHECPVPQGRQTIVVYELTARSPSARAALLSIVGRQRDQVDEVELLLPWGDPLVYAFPDAAGSRRGDAALLQPLGRLGAGPMVRLISARRALEQRGYCGEGSLIVRFPGDPRGLQLTVVNGRGQVSPAPASENRGRSEPCELELSPEVLASIVAAGMRPQEAAELGLLSARPAALRSAEALFGGPRFEVLDPF